MKQIRQEKSGDKEIRTLAVMHGSLAIVGVIFEERFRGIVEIWSNVQRD